MGRKNAKKADKVESIDTSNFQDEDIEIDPDVANLISEALAMKVRDAKRSIEAASLREALVSTVQEFLNGFIIIGFDNSGEPVAIANAKTRMETEALVSFLQKFYVGFMRRYHIGDDDGE